MHIYIYMYILCLVVYRRVCIYIYKWVYNVLAWLLTIYIFISIYMHNLYISGESVVQVSLPGSLPISIN